MSKKETSPLQIKETELLAELLKSEQVILERIEANGKLLNKAESQYDKYSAELTKLSSVKVHHLDLSQSLGVSEVELNQSWQKLKKAEKELAELQEKPEQLRKEAIEELEKNLNEQESIQEKELYAATQEFYELRTNYRNVQAIKGKLEPGGEIFINETAMEESEAAIENLNQEIVELEESEIACATLITEISIKKEAIQALISTNLDTVMLDGIEAELRQTGSEEGIEERRQELLGLLDQVKQEKTEDRAKFLSNLLDKTTESEERALEELEGIQTNLQDKHQDITKEKQNITKFQYEITSAIESSGMTAEKFKKLRPIAESEILLTLQLREDAISTVMSLDDEEFQQALKIFDQADLSTLETTEILLLQIANSVRDTDDIDQELAELLADTQAQKDKLLAKGIEPAEETTKQRRDNSLENVTSLEKALHTAYEDNPKALKKFREVPLFDQEQLKGLYKEPVTIHIEEQLDVLKAAEKRLKSKLQETRKEHYIKSDEHVSAQTRLAEAQLQAELDLREVTSKRDSLRAEMKNLETEFLGLEAKREEIQKSITTQEAIIKGLEQTVEIEQWQAAEKPLSIKQQIKLNKEKMALVDNFNKSLSELSPEVIKHQKASLELQARELQEKNQLIERLQSELIGINAELHKKEGQQLGEGTSLAEQLQETSEIEGLRQQLQAKDQENGALKAQLLEAETAHKSEVEGLQTQLTSARSEASELQAQITFNAEALASLKSENTATQSASKEKLATLQAELASAQLSGSEQVTSLQQQLDALTASNTEQLAQHKAAETEAQLQLASLKTEHASALQTAKEAASQVESAHKERVAELKKQITTAKQNEQEAQSSLAATKLELSALQSEQSTLGEELEAAQQSLKSGKGNKLELESQIAQLEQTIKDNTASITELQQEQSAKEAVHKEAVAQTKAIHLAEVQELQSQLTVAKLIKEDNVERLAASKASIKQLTQEKSALSKELALVKTQSLKRKDNGSVDKELEARIRHLTELSRKNTEELEKLKQQKPSQQKDVDKSTQSVAAVEARLKLSAQQAEEITEIVQQPIAKEKITDKVAITSDDQILNDFRELKKMQYDTIHGILTNIPHGIEAFHDYAAKNGNEIGEFMTHSEGAVNLLADIEREKYKEIHNKYAYEDIEWNDRNQASITKDGIEICKLGNQKTKEEGHEYSLNDKIISNYRNLDVPLKTEEGPVHMSFVVRDLQGKNISAKEAVYLTAHYDKKGKLVEMTTPVPVYYTGTDKESPICIKQNGKIYTLPVNRGKYEEMMQEIAINKGLHKDKVTHKSQNTGQAMDYISTAKNIGKTVSKAPLKSTVVALPKSQRRNVKEQTR